MNKELVKKEVEFINERLKVLCNEIEKEKIDYDMDLKIIDLSFCNKPAHKNVELIVELREIIQ